jgi:hypothetical protein
MLNDLRVAFMRRAFILSAIIAMLACSVSVQADTPSPTPKPKLHLPVMPMMLELTVHNVSLTCVWVSVAYGTFYTPWVWIKGNDDAQFIRPNGRHTFHGLLAKPPLIPVPMEAKVEGTFMTHADCSGTHARPAITAIRKNIYSDGFAPHKAIVHSARADLSGRSVSTFRIDIYT